MFYLIEKRRVLEVLENIKRKGEKMIFKLIHTHVTSRNYRKGKKIKNKNKLSVLYETYFEH